MKSCSFHISPPPTKLTIAQQRKAWLAQFLKAFLVVFLVYLCMYLIRNNFKAAQPLLKSEYGLSTTQLGYIGLAFSITYGIGKTAVGFFADGRNSKKLISFLLICSSIIVLAMGIILASFGSVVAVFVVLWGLNGLFQSVGGPASYSTITRWAPRSKRGKWLGFWNASHNIGGALAGVAALWGARVFFGGHPAGMFIFPAIVCIIIGSAGYFIGKDDPKELGWNRCEEIFKEPIEEDNLQAETLPKKTIFARYVLRNPWIWMLCIANIFTYIIRIGIDNWAPVYVTEELDFTIDQAVQTIFYFEIGALIASLMWGWISDLVGGRRALVGGACLIVIIFAIGWYQTATTVSSVNLSLFVLGALVFGPQLLIGVSLVGFVPKKAVSVTNGLTGTFGYLFGDSLAKVGLAAIADPEKNGLSVFGHTLHGWPAVFTVLHASAILGIVLLAIVAIGEERRIRKLAAANRS